MQNEQQVSSHELVVPITIELHPSLGRVLDAQDSLHALFTQALVQELTEVMDTLGIPGKPTLQITPLPEGLISSNRFLKVSINGHVCRYPDDLLQRVHSHMHGVQLNPEAKPALILTWLCELSKVEPERAELKHKRLVEFLSLACLEIIKRQPSALLGLAQVARYSAELPNPTGTLKLRPDVWPPDPEWLHPILSKVLQFNISLRDKQIVARVLARSKGRSQEDVVEDLVDELRSDIIEFHISREYLKQLSISTDSYGHFVSLRNFLFQELGLRYPEFRFVQVESLKPNSFTCKINNLTMLPWIGLQSNQCCIHAAANYLQSLQVPARPVINPIWGLEGRVIDASVLDDVKAEGVITLDPLQYLFDCLFVHLKENSQCFVYRREVQDQLVQLGKTYPALLKAVQGSVSVEQVTRVLRTLVSEEISVSNLRFILERMLDYDYLFTDPDNFMAYEDRLPIRKQPGNNGFDDPVNIASFIRIGLKRYISRKFADGEGKLNAYMLHTESMRKLLESQDSSIEYDLFLEFLRSKINSLSPGILPVLLTTLDLRPSLHSVVASELPRIPMLAYEERTPDMKLNRLE